MAMKLRFNADNHAFSWVIAPVNGFGSASFMDMAMYVAETSYSHYQDGPEASYCCSAGIVCISQYIIVACCI